MTDFWRKETEQRLEHHKYRILELNKKLQGLKSSSFSMNWSEVDFSLRNIENAIANERFYAHKLEQQLACNHHWECLGGGGQIITEICRKCGASFDY